MKKINPVPSSRVLNPAGRIIFIPLHPRRKRQGILGRCGIKILSLIILLGFVIPLISFADGDYQIDGTTVHYIGLVPCGKGCYVAGEDSEVTMPCQLCHFLVMFKGLIDFLLIPTPGHPVPLSFVILVLLIVISGLLFFFAGGIEGMPETYERAKKVFTTGIYGILIMFGAWVFLGLFFSIIGVAEWLWERDPATGKILWWQINCPITPPPADFSGTECGFAVDGNGNGDGGNGNGGCEDECTPSGTRRCVEDVADQYQECGDFDGDTCLEWGTEGCDSYQVCRGEEGDAQCEPADACDENGCSCPGQKRCDGSYDYRVCELGDEGCLEWGEKQHCELGYCEGSECSASCKAVGF